ncbi:MAG: acyl carrier protein [Clostridium sp.]|nr:acyl carrier protein [Clostridium sp.]MCM1399662.1 acyl carrier protein [Clostridium sp.]MCM1460522.1 acyl carrier protein [Bacteroides sp.]
MDKEQIKKKLEEVIRDVMPDVEDINMTSSITDIYGVNSVSLIRLIVAAESKFDVEFSDYELALSSYDTFGDLAAVISEKLAE